MNLEDICPQEFSAGLQEDGVCLNCLQGNPNTSTTVLCTASPTGPSRPSSPTSSYQTSKVPLEGHMQGANPWFPLMQYASYFASPLQRLSQNGRASGHSDVLALES